VSNPLDGLMADIIARIEAGAPPWRQPWTGGAEPGLPLRANGEPFTGSNAWTLAFIGALKGYVSPYWFTFRQALGIEAPVAKGEKASPAVLYKVTVKDGEADPVTGDPSDPQVLRYLRAYHVFNAEQLQGCPERFLRGPAVDPAVRAAAQDSALDAVPADIRIGGPRACYIPSLDQVRLPPPEAFVSLDEFKSTKAHELVHWTSAPSRLNRELGRRFGDDAYAFEELVAEIGSAILGLKIGLAPQLLDSHAGYLAHWAKVLKDRPHALISASSLAQKAADFLIAFSQPAEVEQLAA
jgi:antirestriction protein ArdC